MKQRSRQGQRSNESGTALIEFALVVVLIAVMAVSALGVAGRGVARGFEASARLLGNEQVSTTTTTAPITTTTAPITTTTVCVPKGQGKNCR
jgi:Flp pilus assembly pilin Flp